MKRYLCTAIYLIFCLYSCGSEARSLARKTESVAAEKGTISEEKLPLTSEKENTICNFSQTQPRGEISQETYKKELAQALKRVSVVSQTGAQPTYRIDFLEKDLSNNDIAYYADQINRGKLGCRITSAQVVPDKQGIFIEVNNGKISKMEDVAHLILWEKGIF